MAELEVDQTNLPRVQEVCQCFAVLEDGALAHNLQEQEIEQYYTTNIQKNQLVQNDIRVAKKLQDEEEEQWAKQSALHRQASKQLEERDFEYARLIQEEILHRAEEAQRREQDDEEMAKRIQDEETQCLRRASRGQDDPSEGSATTPPLPPPHQHTLSSPEQVEEQFSTSATKWQSSTSYGRSSVPELKAGSCRAAAPPNHTNSWSNERHTDSFRKFRSKFGELSIEDSEDSDTVFSEHSVSSQRVNDRLQTSPLRRQASLHQPHERKFRSRKAHGSVPDELRVWEEEGEEKEEWEEDQHENGEVEKRGPWIWHQERLQREERQELQRFGHSDKGSGLGEVRERRCNRSESLRLHDRRRQSNRELARTWSYKDNPDKHVHFQDESRSNSREAQSANGVWAMLGHVLRERGVPVRISNGGASLQILGPQSRDSQVLYGSEVSCSDSQPLQRSFQRASTTRHSFHGDTREKRRLSYRESSGRDHREDKERLHNVAERRGEIYEISSRESYLANREKEGSRRWRDHRSTSDHTRERNENDFRLNRTTDERRNRYNTVEERVSSEEEEQRRGDQPGQRAPQRSQSLRSSNSSSSRRSSFRASTRRRSRHMAADSGEARLDLGELQQVLQDEELAHKMQQEEEKHLRRIKNSQSSPPTCYPEGDFRVAQVAQDEEIAHFMQKQEMKSKRRSRELEGPSSWREHRAMISNHDRRASRDRQVHRERLDSEGLPSPIEDCSPENQPTSPTSATLQSQHIRNIAEELDPTFQASTLSTERGSQGAGLTSQTLPVQPHDFPDQPTFVPPTKRQTDKSGRPKPKEKRENCKQQ